MRLALLCWPRSCRQPATLGRTLIHEWAMCLNPDPALLRAACSSFDIDAANAVGRSALAEAIWRGRLDVVTLLLASGANPWVHGARAFWCAVEQLDRQSSGHAIWQAVVVAARAYRIPEHASGLSMLTVVWESAIDFGQEDAARDLWKEGPELRARAVQAMVERNQVNLFEDIASSCPVAHLMLPSQGVWADRAQQLWASAEYAQLAQDCPAPHVRSPARRL